MYIFIVLTIVPPLIAAFSIHVSARDACDCTGTNPDPNDTISICGDWRLGPIQPPAKLPYVSLVSNYDRFGLLTPGEFLQKWWNDTAQPPTWKWPGEDGFGVDSSSLPIKGDMLLEVGTLVDRFGSEGGAFLAGADSPYNQRSVPPSSLNTRDRAVPNNYYLYKVVRRLPVVAGPITPWFEQPGLGLQFYTGWLGNVAYLLREGYLQKVPIKDIIPGPGPPKCGR